MHLDRFWTLYAKTLAGEASDLEKEELNAILQSHSELAFSAQALEEVWTAKAPENPSATSAAYQKQLNLLEKDVKSSEEHFTTDEGLRKKSFFKYSRLVVGVVAGLLLLFSARLLYRNLKATLTVSPAPQSAEIISRPGTRTKLLLPDSSVVWLNGGSKLSYGQSFGTTDRNTVLSGEAFFDVRKGPVPFIIQTEGVQVKVMGTAFNVKSYPGEDLVETSLIRGRVEVTVDHRPGEKFVLRPNEKLTVSNNLKPQNRQNKRQPIFELNQLTQVGDSLIVETSWVNNKLVFHDEEFEDVARKMERWYNVEIEIRDSELADQRVGGGPFENENVKQALSALQFAFDFNFSQKGNKIVITR